MGQEEEPVIVKKRLSRMGSKIAHMDLIGRKGPEVADFLQTSSFGR